jgi:hypothetical protein
MIDKARRQDARKRFNESLARFKRMKKREAEWNLPRNDNFYWGMLNGILHDYLLSRGIDRDEKHFNTYSVRKLQKNGFFWSRSLNRIRYDFSREEEI